MTDPIQTLTRSAYTLAYQLMGKQEDATDVLQDAAAVALSHATAPSRKSDEFKPWFFKVVRNKALDQLRKQQRFTHESLEQTSASLISNDEPDRCLQTLRLKDSIHNALMKLETKHREIILLKDYHGFSYIEISQVLELPKGSVMSRLHRARLALRKVLGDRNQFEVHGNDTL